MNTGTAVVLSVVIIAGAALAYAVLNRPVAPVVLPPPQQQQVQQVGSSASNVVGGIASAVQGAGNIIKDIKNIFGGLF